MEQYNSYRNDPSVGNSDFRRMLKQRKDVPVNTGIILLNIFAFLLVELTGSSLNSRHMLACGAAGTFDIAQNHEYYRLATAMFLHFGIQHLGNNMLVLFFIGDCLERNIGKWKYFTIYILGGISANYFSFLLELRNREYVVSAGASGAVFAAIGALLYVVIKNKGRVENFTMKQLLVMAVLSLYHGIASAGVDNAAHFGGLFSGFFLAVLFYHGPKRKRYY